MRVTTEMLRIYVRDNLIAGLKTPPTQAPLYAWSLLPLFAVFAIIIGARAGLLAPGFIGARLAIVLSLTLFVFPSLLEEAFFRGLLIPRNTKERGAWAIAGFIFFSTVLFVLWHPLNALTINPAAAPLFLDPSFLIIVTALGITCSFGYIYSKSLWVPVVIHWLTVLIWVLGLGGRNLILEGL